MKNFPGPPVFSSRSEEGGAHRAHKCESPTSTAVNSIDIPMKIEPHSIFEDDDLEISANHTENNLNIKETDGNAPEQSYLIYPEEDEVTYTVPVPKNGTPGGGPENGTLFGNPPLQRTF